MPPQPEQHTYQVVETHEWPERACPGPKIVVYTGRSRSQAQAECERLDARRCESGYRFYYEVRERS